MTGQELDAALLGDEPELVKVAKLVRSRRRHLAAFERAFARSTIFAQRPASPGVLVSESSEHGRWVLVFSTLERLGCFAGECDWQSMAGADLLAQIPLDVCVLLDAQDSHAMPIFVPPSGRSLAAGPNR